jgi:nicotine blue oxidoreductase
MVESLADHRVLVLAAGRGRRMGGPKALMTVDGEAWWRRQERVFASAGVRSLWVVSTVVEEALRSAPEGPAARVVADGDAPMFESVLAGVRALAQAPPAGVFVLPVDVPAPERATLARLAAASPVAVPRCAGATGHPVRLAWGWVREHLLAGEPAARRLDLLIEPDAASVDVEDDAVLLNLNTPEDLEAWARRRREE